ADAETLYEYIIKSKVNTEKGYKKIHLSKVSDLIGSSTLKSTTTSNSNNPKQSATTTKEASTSSLPIEISRLVKHLYEKASKSITDTVVAKITTEGIETPLGILSEKQISKGEKILLQIYDELNKLTFSS